MRPLLEVVAVRLHCGACGDMCALIGSDVRECAKAWAAAHYLPVVDEMDLADPCDGAQVCTWRRQVAA